ncbi:hypothetical protein H5410_041338 [Solanum commersonii]|uniref:Uncharacterized protein n=1 Tax=Solanum commersonii TaxID=4109 RepID=A0A9J5XUH1_SOLCO|nr:hypothetical protein H5410_041338 [Solanum commersonii]
MSSKKRFLEEAGMREQLIYCVAPTQGKTFGEENCCKGEKLLLTNQSSKVNIVLSSNDAYGLNNFNSKWFLDSAMPVGKRFIQRPRISINMFL